MTTKKKKKEYYLEIVDGVEGKCVYLNGYRIAGPKPWGGGTVVKCWLIPAEDVATALKQP